MSGKSIWRLKVTARHLLENLAADLYKDAADCVMEIVRNGLCACMPNGKWAPRLGFVEVFLVYNHPLGPKSWSLVILDHGSGFTDEAIKLYCNIGPAINEAAGGHSGAAQKRIGRFAAFALNLLCMNNRDISSGFFILTRTSSEGPVTMVSMIPEKIELQDGMIITDTVSPNSTELGPQKGIKGSFTAIVIPNSVFENHEQIKQALMWRVPRKKDQMYRLEIGGKQIVPPPLANKVVVLQEDGGSIEAYIDRIKDNEDPNGGIWLTDADTGLRVASARALGHQKLPWPLWKPDMIGDIFIPNLLANQDTSRSGLSSRYLASSAWKKVTAYLIGQVVPKAKALLGDDDIFGRDAASKSIISFVERCNEVYGRAEAATKGCIFFEDGPGGRGNTNGTGHPAGTGGKGTRGPQLNPSKTRKGRPRALPVRIGDKVYVINKRPMDARSYAEVDISNGQVININNGEYVAMPTTKEARDEHVLLKIFEAVGYAKYPDSVNEVKHFVAERRRDFLKKSR